MLPVNLYVINTWSRHLPGELWFWRRSMDGRLLIRIGSKLSLAICLALLSHVAIAQTKRKRAEDAERHASAAAKVFNEIMATPDKSIPRELIDKAEAIAVFPGTLKAAFVFGGRGGQGVISRRTVRGWSEPAFYNLGGGSFGLQIGAEKTDFVLLI